MLAFFDLPRPIRDLVYSHVLSSTLPHSISLSEFHASDRYQRIFRHGNDIAEANIERLVRYPTRIYLPFEGLLHTSRRIRTEFKDAILKLQERKVECRLDLVIESESRMYPTWLKCPARSPKVHRLDVDIRFFGFPDQEDLDDVYVHGRNRCRTLAFAVVAVVSRFLERGARFEHARGEIKVDNVILNFSSRGEEPKISELPTPASSTASVESMDWDTETLVYSEEDREEDERNDRDPDDTVDAGELLRTVDLVLKPLCRDPRDWLVRRRTHFSAAYLELIRRNVRRILLVLDGKLVRHVHIKKAVE